MMKKILILVLSLTMMLGIPSAFAETYHITEDFESFDVILNMPEGAKFQQNIQEGLVCVEITFEESKPLFDLNVSPSEDYDGKSLIDFTDEEKEQLLETEGENFYHPFHEFFITPSGNMILLIKENMEDIGFATMVTLYRGFYFSLYCNYADYRPLTDADIDLMHKITEGTDIITAAK